MEILNSNTKTKKKTDNLSKIKELKPSQQNKSKSISKSKSRSRSRSKGKENTTNTVEKESEKPNNISTIKTYPDFPSDENKIIKIIHWNINGLRNLIKTKELDELIKQEDPDIICFNEIKIDKEIIPKMNLNFYNKEKYKSFWYSAEGKNWYAGTGILTKYEPKSVSYGMNIDKHDKEGRIITLEYDKFYLICCYTPNSGVELKRLNYRINEWDKDFFQYINSLKEKKDIILTGDLNVAKGKMDIFEPRGHEKFAGYTQVERESFMKFLKMGYIDTFRDLHPKEQKYSFFTSRGGNRAKELNKGWRLDYFIINQNSKNIEIKESDMLDKGKYNASDHIPIFIKFISRQKEK